MYEGEITKEELDLIVKKLKRRKTPGPDEIPMEAFKEMDDENLEHLLKTLNEWWKHEEIPEEILEARIAMIFKKGDTSDLNNYRPIALLNSTYKIIASIIQNRIAEKLDEQLQKNTIRIQKEKKHSASNTHNQKNHRYRRKIRQRNAPHPNRLGKSIRQGVTERNV